MLLRRLILLSLYHWSFSLYWS